MYSFLKRLPIPTSGLMLGLMSLLKLYASLEWYVASALFFACGLLLFILLVAKIIFVFPSIIEDLQNPIIASVAPTFPMGTMILASMLIKSTALAPLAQLLWFIAIALQFILIGYFTYHFVFKQALSLQDVYPSWFILYVGLGIVPVTADAFVPQFTHLLFWIVLINYVLLLPTMLLRLWKHSIEESAKPLLTILAAPGSLCLTGYLQSFELHNHLFVYALLIISQILYIFVLIQLPTLLRLPFYPSYAAFTFPLVICATALFTTANVMHIPSLKWLANFELLVASCVVIYVFVRYTLYFFSMPKALQ